MVKIRERSWEEKKLLATRKFLRDRLYDFVDYAFEKDIDRIDMKFVVDNFIKFSSHKKPWDGDWGDRNRSKTITPLKGESPNFSYS